MGVITLKQAAAWCGGQIDEKYSDVAFFGASNDTRKLEKGQLFVALQGERDGHDFIPAALEKGAAAVLCTHCDGDYPAIVVPDTRIALGEIARQERQRLGMKVVAVTGSVGKSTTKEMIASVLGTTWRVSKTPANHNNDIGMPMAILAMPEDTEIAVLEMGMNHFREIAYLSQIGKPDIAVIVNIGTMHIEHLGSREGILQAKLEILEGMSGEKCVIFNGDEPMLWNLQGNQEISPTYFGVTNAQNGVFATDICQQEGKMSFCVQAGEQSFPVTLPVEGIHNVLDALAAVAVGLQMKLSPAKIAEGLENFKNMEGRQQIYTANGYTIIEDCYNAGPESMAAALGVLSNRPGRRIAVLGEMLELGVSATAEHYKVGRVAAESADLLFAYGPTSRKMVKGALTGGMPNARAFAFEDRDKLVKKLKQSARPGDVILFKGSRGMRMELALQAFLQEDK